jgi:hypothetical protein
VRFSDIIFSSFIWLMPFRQQLNWTLSFQVNQNSAVPSAFGPSTFINAQDAWGRDQGWGH